MSVTSQFFLQMESGCQNPASQVGNWIILSSHRINMQNLFYGKQFSNEFILQPIKIHSRLWYIFVLIFKYSFLPFRVLFNGNLKKSPGLDMRFLLSRMLWCNVDCSWIPFSSVCLLPLDDTHAHTGLIPDTYPQPQNIFTIHQSNRFMADSPSVACPHTA